VLEVVSVPTYKVDCQRIIELTLRFIKQNHINGYI